MRDSWYDIAQICINGHVITTSLNSSPENSVNFCSKCGKPTISKCQNCNTPIRGFYHIVGVIYSGDFKLPHFCHECGKQYPWTEAKLEAAKEFADMLEELSPEERDILKKSLDTIVTDTPQTPIAANKIKILAAKVGKATAKQLRELVVDIASETAKKIILSQGN